MPKAREQLWPYLASNYSYGKNSRNWAWATCVTSRTNWPIRSITRVKYHQLTWYNSLWLLGMTTTQVVETSVYSGLRSPRRSYSSLLLMSCFFSNKTVADPGGRVQKHGPPPPSNLTLVWDWNSYIDRIVHHFWPGWFFNETCVAFCHYTKFLGYSKM